MLADINLKIRVANIPVAALTQIKVLIAFARPPLFVKISPAFNLARKHLQRRGVHALVAGGDDDRDHASPLIRLPFFRGLDVAERPKKRQVISDFERATDNEWQPRKSSRQQCACEGRA